MAMPIVPREQTQVVVGNFTREEGQIIREGARRAPGTWDGPDAVSVGHGMG